MFQFVTPKISGSRVSAPTTMPSKQSDIDATIPVTPSLLLHESNKKFISNLHSEIQRQSELISKQKEIISKLNARSRDMLAALAASSEAVSKSDARRLEAEVLFVLVFHHDNAKFRIVEKTVKCSGSLGELSDFN